ncbi:MAG: alpha/beta fold hydrolase [Acidimicrobiales bacterium]
MGAYKNPIVLLHGTGLTSAMWDGFRAALIADGADESSIHTIDLLGHGETPRPRRPLHIDDYVRQVRKLILRHDLGGVHVLGHSLGGIVALALARAHPDLVEQAAVIGVPYGRTDEQRNEWLDIIMSATRQNEDDDEDDPVGEVVPILVKRWCNGKASAAFADSCLREVDPITFGLVFRISMTSEPALEEMAPEISVPVTVCAGSRDSEVDAAGVDELARALVRGAGIIVDGHHHLGILDRPADYLRVLR